MEDNKLTVKFKDGRSVVINVYDIIEHSDTNKKYIVYDLDGYEDDNVYISILNESENSFTLETIEDENELKMVEDYLTQINSENGDM